ncbi:MAG: hypothetical protein IVW54_04145 [Candidatus Binataceae bacterium]|nr:hypothetical protein [Candidatus Binataceae bacterium]
MRCSLCQTVQDTRGTPRESDRLLQPQRRHARRGSQTSSIPQRSHRE